MLLNLLTKDKKARYYFLIPKPTAKELIFLEFPAYLRLQINFIASFDLL